MAGGSAHPIPIARLVQAWGEQPCQRCLSPFPIHPCWDGPVALAGIDLARIYFKKQKKMRK